MPATFGDIYEQLCERHPDPRERGRRFEPLVADILRTDRMFSERYSRVWLWADWPDRESGDIGVDIVAELADGSGYAAIQCKCYEPTTTLQKSHLNSFLAYTNPDFVERIVVSTTTDWSDKLLTLMKNQQPPVQRLDLFRLEATTIDWDRYLEDETRPLQQRRTKELRPHQEAALSDVYAGFERHDRGKLIMACGTGKTFTALRAAEHLAGKGGRVLFAAPSISLVNQSLREWTAESRIRIRAFAVCSDSRVGEKDGDSARTYDLPIPATTNAQRLAREASKDAPNHLTVVFSTYQSMQRIAEAQDAGMPAFDLVICDEAHRTTGALLKGKELSNFLLVHEAEKIRAAKRLYMTATPRVYAPNVKKKASENEVYLASMDNVAQYGEEFHRLDFPTAVEQNLLSDYKVAVLVMSEEQVNLDYSEELGDAVAVGDVGRVIGCLNGLAKLDHERRQFADDPAPMQRAVAFSNKIDASKRFVDLVAQLQGEEDYQVRGVRMQAQHVDGKSGVLERAQKLRWLGDQLQMQQQCHILSNARCLTEGIDVPSLDAVLFLQPRKSQIDVVQAVGRVMRRAEGKKWGYIILPIVVPAGEDPNAALDNNDAYAHVWEVLQALRSHDSRLDAWINKLDLNQSTDGPVQIIGVGPRGGEDQDEDESGEIGRERGEQLLFQGIDEQLEQWRDAIYAKILKRCGRRDYLKNWAGSVGEIARRHQARIKADIDKPGPAREHFVEFVAALKSNLNDSISEKDATAMLSQHLITKPVFDALFGSSDFTARNPVSLAMQQMVAALADRGLEAETEELNPFYADVRARVEGIDNAEGRQRVAIELYDNFFRNAFPKDVERLGIVYTPVEIVDFIIRAVSDLLQSEFGAALGDKGVHILDPFAGTGTFVARLLQSGLINPDDLPRKYRDEIHANEIMLLAYYIAAVNIENVYRDAMQAVGEQVEYEPFSGIVLTDTFQASEPGERHDMAMFPRNNDRMRRQLGLDIRVIIGNPPWSAGQRRQNDNNQTRAYPALDGNKGLTVAWIPSIAGTYVAKAGPSLKRALYDPQVRAVRWASNRILGSKDGGIVAFVVNNGFIDGKAFDGFRKTVASEFDVIYVYNLRGKARMSGEQRRKEKGGVFDAGTRVGVAVLVLLKRAGQSRGSDADIYYRDIGDNLTASDKLEVLAGSEVSDQSWTLIHPNEYGDWIYDRSERFLSLRPLRQKDAPDDEDAVFTSAGNGVNSSRDAWVYNSSIRTLRSSIDRTVAFFNSELDRIGGQADALSRLDRDGARFSWDQKTERRLTRGRALEVAEESYREALYRPYFRQRVYFNNDLNASSSGHRDTWLPATPNHGIFVSTSGGAAIAVDRIPDFHTLTPDGRVLMRWTYESPADKRDSASPRQRVDNITDLALAAYQARYGDGVSKDHIFAYVYGVLHSPDYRERYATDLARMLPRIPEVTTADAFYAFAEAGQDLLDLHIGYEEVEPYPLEEVWSGEAPADDERWYVRKMKWAGTSKAKDRSAIVVNDWLTLRGIPEEAQRYVVGPRSALDWLIDRYRVRTDKPSGIVNDPNDWGLELDPPQPDYIPTLIKRIVTVSLETMRLVDSLPPLEEAD